MKAQDDFVDIAGQVLIEELRIGGKQVLERALRSLDLAGEDRLLADVREDEEVGIREREHGAVKWPGGTVGRGKEPMQLAGEMQRAAQNEESEALTPVETQTTKPL